MTTPWPPEPDARPSALDVLDPWPVRTGPLDPRFDYIPGGDE